MSNGTTVPSWIQTQFTLQILLVLGLVLLPAPVVAQTPLHVIENDALRIGIDPAKGGLVSLIHKESAIDFRQSTASTGLLWQFYVVMPDDSRELSHNLLTSGFRYSSSSAGQTTTSLLEWSGLRTDKGTRYPNAIVSVTITLAAGERQSVWHWKVSGLRGVKVASVLFPYFNGVRPLGADESDDVLLMPQEEGRLFHNPLRLARNAGNGGPSAFFNAQLMAYYDKAAGFYMSTRDTAGNTKGTQWFPYDKDYAWAFSYVPDLTPQDSLEIPYDATVGVFTGDWSTAADMYRDWAYKQSWVTMAMKKDTPAWLRDAAVGVDFCALGCSAPNDGPYTNYVKHVLDFQAFFKLPVVGMMWGWEHYGEWAYGDWFPPQEGWTAFDQAITSLHTASNRSYLFIGWTALDMVTALWTGGTLSESAVLDSSGKTIIASIPGHRFVTMDISSAAWQQVLVNAGTTLASHGVDLIQLDGFPWGAREGCFSTAHSHPPGNGLWQMNATADLLTRFRTSVRDAKPDAAISGEGIAEVYLPWLDMYHSRDNWFEVKDADQQALGAEPVPLFEYLYHPLIVSLGQHNIGIPRDATLAAYHRLSLARILTWGQIADLNWPPPISSGDPRSSQFMSDIAKARTGFARKYLVDGSMLSPPAIQSSSVTLTWQVSPDKSGQFPALQHSAWQASDGTTGIILTNISDQAETANIPITISRLKLSPGVTYSAEYTDGTTTTALSGGFTGNTSFQIPVPSLKVLLVKISPSKVAIQPKGVVMAAAFGASPTLAPNSWIEIYGVNLSPSSREWNGTDFAGARGPTALAGVQVTIGGAPAVISYVSPGQINALTPADIPSGTTQIVVRNSMGVSEPYQAVVARLQPALLAPQLLNINGKSFVAAFLSDGALALPNNSIPGVASRPAAPGDSIVLYGIGFGPVTPTLEPGTIVNVSNSLSTSLVVTIDNAPVSVQYAGLAPGLVGVYQFNLVLPNIRGDGAVQIAFNLGGSAGSQLLYLAYKQL
jgi:uncharacterized protein (TIGR03437 family)